MSRFLRPVLPASTILAVICLFDMGWTIAAIKMRIAHESNPLLSSLCTNMILFALVKMATFLIPIVWLELLTARHKIVVSKYMKIGIAMYLLLYILLSIAANR